MKQDVAGAPLRITLPQDDPALRQRVRDAVTSAGLVCEFVAEQELRESEERLQLVWDNSLDGMRLTDARGRIIAVNPAYCRLFKLPQERLLGELFTATYAPETAESLLESYHRRFENGGVHPPLTTRAKLWNGTLLDLDISTCFIEVGVRGKMALTIFRDVSERCRTEAALQAAQQRLQYLLAQSPAVIYSLRVEQGTLVPDWVSNYVQHLLGFTPEECCQRDWWVQQIHADDRAALERSLPELLRGRQLVFAYRIRHKQGEYRWVRDERRLVCDEQGEPREVLGSWVDITERKALEELLRHSQKMEAVGLLAGGVAHDFNNLLLVMRGNAELMLMDADQYSVEARECLRQITAAAERAANLTRQLLVFSRKQVLQSKPLSLNEVIANLTKMLKRIIGEHIDLQCRYGAGLPAVQADAGMIEQVLLNLVVNARDAMPRGGKMEIGTDQVSLTDAAIRANPEARAGQFVRLTVRDSGTGIAPQILSHVFEPFFTTKEHGKGTGLGLATVYGIVKQHEGWIEVNSQLGQGTVFTIFLPALSGAALAEAAAHPETPPLGGTEPILLVEDESAVRLVTRRVLESFGYKVEEAAHAHEALELWGARPEYFRLLLTDMVMPQGITGRELAERLRRENPQLRIVFMSGYSAEIAGRDTEFFRRHRCHFIQKPCSSRLLLETVRTCLDEPLPAQP
jgi:two-component system cell cycle sensor histidine kinase/response regulator CckA